MFSSSRAVCEHACTQLCTCECVYAFDGVFAYLESWMLGEEGRVEHEVLMCMHACVHVCISVCVCVCVSVCLCVCVCVCV